MKISVLSIHQNRWLRLSSDSRQTNGSVLRGRNTNPHHAIDKNGVYLKIQHFLVLNENIIFLSYFLLKVLEHTHTLRFNGHFSR